MKCICYTLINYTSNSPAPTAEKAKLIEMMIPCKPNMEIIKYQLWGHLAKTTSKTMGKLVVMGIGSFIIFLQ